jgi:hypothetical protein
MAPPEVWGGSNNTVTSCIVQEFGLVQLGLVQTHELGSKQALIMLQYTNQGRGACKKSVKFLVLQR